MNYNHNDGGNPKGVSDCVARAIAITLNRPYYEVAQALAPFTQQGGVNIADAGFLAYMDAHGFKRVEVLTRRTVAGLPDNCIAHTANHFSAIVGGVVNDTIDTRLEIVRAYWVRGTAFNVVLAGVVKNSAPLNFNQAVAMRKNLAYDYFKFAELYSNEI